MKQKTIYPTAIRSAVTGGSKVWTLSNSDENTLAIWERNILWKNNIQITNKMYFNVYDVFNHTFLANVFRVLLCPLSGWNYYKNTKVHCGYLCRGSLTIKYYCNFG